MSAAPLGLFELRPLPVGCRHDAKGLPHRNWRDLWRCLARYGVPGFEIAEIPTEVGP